jgi:hypothetical protein
MRNRSRQWMARAGAEYRSSARTWMVTFTTRPEEDALMDLRIFRDHPSPSPEELFRLRSAEFHRLVAEWRARLYGDSHKSRRTSSYLAVCERHKGDRTSPVKWDRPHYHVLLHEKIAEALIPDRDCEWAMEKGQQVYRVKDGGRARQLWPVGFSKLILCFSEGSAVYVCKYLDIEDGATGRVKASPRYGEVVAEAMPQTNSQNSTTLKVLEGNSSAPSTGDQLP